ncbi:MAG: glycosyltransferase family 39 protein [Cytophagaceae bacterium]|nr:glycosyltransferase family 39 protein [Cytophagaceae bacterium]
MSQYLYHRKFHVAFLLLLAFGFYFNTLFNEYALDDEAVITQNRLTKKGIEGIKDLATHHLFYGFIENESKVGLYRPLPLITHALEYEFFGKNPFVSHLINVLLYVFIVHLLYTLLSKYIFHDKLLLSFMASLLFTIHPIHTEVVANIKSRDELLSLMFILGALIFLFSYLDHKKASHSIISILFYTAALFSKESAITFIPVIALMLYFFRDEKVIAILKKTLPYLAVGIIYIIVKLILTGFTSQDNEFILNTPYLYANAEQEFTTKVFVLFKYITLLFFPHPLSYDYCYNQIPYCKFSDFRFIIAVLVLSVLVFTPIKKFREKSIFSFSILFFFLTISIVSNFVFKIGAPMGERFLFVPSIGFSIAIAWLLYQYIHTSNTIITGRLKIISALFLVLVFTCGFKTITRNADWKNNITLFTRDAESAPNSIRTLTNGAAFSYYYVLPEIKDSIKKEKLAEDIIQKLSKAIRIDPKFAEPYVHLSFIYMKENRLDEAGATFKKAYRGNLLTGKFEPVGLEISDRYVLRGRSKYEAKDLNAAISDFDEALFFNNGNYDAWWNLGGIYLEKGEIKKTVECWEKTVALQPGNAKAKELLERIKRDFAGRF